MDKLVRCKKCGRKPKIKIERFPSGCFVTIYCKKPFRKVHQSVSCGKCLDNRAYEEAVKIWNEANNDA